MRSKKDPVPACRPQTLVKISGKDAPGITAQITEILSQHQIIIADIAQAVIQKLLSLSLLFENPKDSERLRRLKANLMRKAKELEIELEFEEISETRKDCSPATKPHHYALTLIADRVTANALFEVTHVLAEWKVNIDVIKRLSEDQFSCVEMLLSSQEAINARVLRKQLLSVAKDQAVDIALQTEGLYRRAKRLVVLDMDSTLIQDEVIDELAREKGVYEKVAEITHSAMQGKMDYNQSLTLRCRLLEGLDKANMENVFNKLRLTPGAEDLIKVLKKLGYKTAVLSGGFSFVADRLKDKLDLDYAFANTLELKNGKLTGEVIPPIVNAQRKADLLDVIVQQEKIDLDQVIAIGDGANDLLMLEKAGLGIAFNAKPLVSEQADLALSQKNMRSILYLLGLSARDVSEATSI